MIIVYVTENEVRNTLGISDTSIISSEVITQAIEFAEDEIDRLTYTTYYPVEFRGSVTSVTNTSLTDSSQSWVADALIGYAVYIYSGTGKGQIREITDNTTTSVTVATWTTNPDTTSKFIITYLNKQTIKIDGTGTYEILLPDYPIVQVDTLKIEDTTIDSDDYTVYNDTGKIILGQDASVGYFTGPVNNIYRKQVEVTYHWGVLPEFKRNTIDLNRIIKRATCLVASLQALAYQMGGTYDDLSTFSLPEFSGSIGQAYINIRSTLDVLSKELEDFKKSYLGKYTYMC